MTSDDSVVARMEEHPGHAATKQTKPKSRSVPGLGGILVWGLARISIVGITLRDIVAQQYEYDSDLPSYSLDEDQAEFLFKLQREDSTHTDDKVKQLLTLSSSLATLVLVFARDVRPHWLAVGLICLLVAAVYLCVSLLVVRTAHVPTLEDASAADYKKQWARDLLAAYQANQARHRLRVDTYRAATRYFRAALLVAPIAAALTVARPDPNTAMQTAFQRTAIAVAGIHSALDSLSRRGLVVTPSKAFLVEPAPTARWSIAQPTVRPGQAPARGSH